VVASRGIDFATTAAMTNQPNEDESTETKRRAMRRGLRMAAKVAAVTGLLAAASAPAQASEAQTSMADAGERAGTAADDLARRVRLGGAKGCGCAPCWGPPAPPTEEWLCEMEVAA
jgi:hypothetical protein